MSRTPAAVLAETLTPAARAAMEVARDYAVQSMSRATERAYAADWAHFTAWCASVGLQSLPADPQTAAAYIASLATTHAPNTLRRRLVGISVTHKLHGYQWDGGHAAISATLKGVLAAHGRATKQATPVDLDSLKALVSTCDASPKGLRDRALLLLAFAGALRRGELCALNIEDLTMCGADGIRVLIRRSKTDQANSGAEIGIPYGAHRETCPVRALIGWICVLNRKSGPLFVRVSATGSLGSQHLTPESVWTVMERRSAAAGLTEALRPHGMRAGFITAAAVAGAHDDEIMQHSRHRDLKTMRGYVRRSKNLARSPARLVGL